MDPASDQRTGGWAGLGSPLWESGPRLAPRVCPCPPLALPFSVRSELAALQTAPAHRASPTYTPHLTLPGHGCEGHGSLLSTP